ncbi:hypothetical protein [Psychrobacillus vulpis]|uniref:hypothetical protein n=1 Tax=Psychrobacillus vulpis TaxID=2325572 RepID=UPI001409F902|nr:hypothetical protein [Psychrobacillus vulpis]
MSKNNKKTMNVRTHNSLDLYKDPTDNPDEEFAADFDTRDNSIVTNKNKKQQSNKKSK